MISGSTLGFQGTPVSSTINISKDFDIGLLWFRDEMAKKWQSKKFQKEVGHNLDSTQVHVPNR